MKLPTTKRLQLNKATTADAAFFLKLMNSPNWLTYIGDRNIRSLADAENYVQKNVIDPYTANGYGLYTIRLKDGEKPIGICGFLKRDYLEHPDIGYAILPKYEGKGYAREAAQAILNYGKLQLNFETVLAVTTSENKSSCNLLKKLGLKEIGTIAPSKDDPEFLLFSNL